MGPDMKKVLHHQTDWAWLDLYKNDMYSLNKTLEYFRGGNINYQTSVTIRHLNTNIKAIEMFSGLYCGKKQDTEYSFPK